MVMLQSVVRFRGPESAVAVLLVEDVADGVVQPVFGDPVPRRPHWRGDRLDSVAQDDGVGVTRLVALRDGADTNTSPSSRSLRLMPPRSSTWKYRTRSSSTPLVIGWPWRTQGPCPA